MMFRKRKESIPHDSPLQLVDNYTKLLNYPSSLGQKVIRKYKKHAHDIHHTQLEQLFHQITDHDDEGALEKLILHTIPEKNMLDCYWHVYGVQIFSSAFFQGLVHPEPNTIESRLFLKTLASQIVRMNVPHGRLLNLGQKQQGSILFIRRGSFDLILNDKLVGNLKPGTVFDLGVLSGDRFGVFSKYQGSSVASSSAGSSSSSSHLASSNSRQDRSSSVSSVASASGRSIQALRRGVGGGSSSSSSAQGSGMYDGAVHYERLTDKKILLKYIGLRARSIRTGKQGEVYPFGCEYGVLTVENLYKLIDQPRYMAYKVNFTKLVVEERRRVSIAIDRQKTAIEEHRKQVVTENHRAANAQLVAAAEMGLEDRARAAVSLGADINFNQTQMQRTPLHVAVIGGYVDVVQQLLEFGADPNATDSEQCTPLHLVCYQNFGAAETLTELLLVFGADPQAKDKDADTPFHIAAGKGQVGVLQCLLDAATHRDPKISVLSLLNMNNESPLAVSASPEVVRLLKPRTNVDADIR